MPLKAALVGIPLCPDFRHSASAHMPTVGPDGDRGASGQGALTSLVAAASLPFDAYLRRVEAGASTINGEDRDGHEGVDDP